MLFHLHLVLQQLLNTDNLWTIILSIPLVPTSLGLERREQRSLVKRVYLQSS